MNRQPLHLSQLLLVVCLWASFCSAQTNPTPDPQDWIQQSRGNFLGHTDRPLRYWPAGTDFVITNGAEYFNRPLYGVNSAFRVDAGDRPEFSLYLPGRGGNLRLGIKTAAGVKWLNNARQIVARYRPGSMLYEIHDPLLGDGVLELVVLPLTGVRGVVIRAQLHDPTGPVQLLWAFGGANGMKGKRGGDIGCEREPVSQFFQLRPEQCKDSEITIATDTFTLRSKSATIIGMVSPEMRLGLGDAAQWDFPEKIKSKMSNPPEFPVVFGESDLPANQTAFLSLQPQASSQPATFNPWPVSRAVTNLPAAFAAAEAHRRTLAERVVVDTPDPFINAAVAALNVAADAIWDEQQQSYMHGAVAWRTRLLGWRGPYAGDVLGWHDRTAAHFAGFARQQNTNPVPASIPSADEDVNLTRNETALHSNGDLTKSHYDMNLVAVDAFFRHLLWTGDLDYAREMWPAIERHFAWERRLFRREFGADKLPLYEAYAAIWASDDLQYDGGGVTHASAYNYWHNQMAARVAKLIGKDPTPYEHEADLILQAMNKYLWLPDSSATEHVSHSSPERALHDSPGQRPGFTTEQFRNPERAAQAGHFAEYKDYLGLQLTHPNAGLWTFYHAMDSEVPTPQQAEQMTHWVDANIAHIPIHGPGVPDEGLYTLPTTSCMPYQWSINNVVFAEVAHTALGFWQAGQNEEAFKMFKGCTLDTMFMGLCPGNVGAMSQFDMARGEAQRDFADGIGVASRALVEGLFGVKPDALAGTLTIRPGFPASWDHASIRHSDFNFSFRREGTNETISVESKFAKPMALELRIPALRSDVASVTVNGQPVKWRMLDKPNATPGVQIGCAAAKKYEVIVKWTGAPTSWSSSFSLSPEAQNIMTATNSLLPLSLTERGTEGEGWSNQNAAQTTQPKTRKLDLIDLSAFFNDQVTQIFRHDYRSPRSPFCSLAMPKQGIGGWCDFKDEFVADDSGLRAAAATNGGRFVLPDGVSFTISTNAAGKNIVFTSQWDNYPHEVTVPLTGRSARAFLLMAGSTYAMQSRLDNGEVIVTCTDGSTQRLALNNPDNWWPIDQDYFIDDYAFRRPGPIPPRVDFRTGQVRLLDASGFKGRGGKIPGGAATVLDLPLDPGKELRSLTVHALANDVVIGLMAVTLERPIDATSPRLSR